MEAIVVETMWTSVIVQNVSAMKMIFHFWMLGAFLTKKVQRKQFSFLWKVRAKFHLKEQMNYVGKQVPLWSYCVVRFVNNGAACNPQGSHRKLVRNLSETRLNPVWNPSETRWKSIGNPLETHWKPVGNLLEIGNPLETCWKPVGNPLETHWKSVGNPAGTRNCRLPGKMSN